MPILMLLSQTIEGVKIQTKAPNFKFLLNRVFDSIFIYYFQNALIFCKLKKLQLSLKYIFSSLNSNT